MKNVIPCEFSGNWSIYSAGQCIIANGSSYAQTHKTHTYEQRKWWNMSKYKRHPFLFTHSLWSSLETGGGSLQNGCHFIDWHFHTMLHMDKNRFLDLAAIITTVYKHYPSKSKVITLYLITLLYWHIKV